MRLDRRDFLRSSGALLGTAVLGEEISTLATRKGLVAEAAGPAPVYEIYALKFAGPYTRKLAYVLFGKGWDENIEVNWYLWAIKGQDGFIVVDTGCGPTGARERKVIGYVSPVEALARIGANGSRETAEPQCRA